jgi:hypothetical protein
MRTRAHVVGEGMLERLPASSPKRQSRDGFRCGKDATVEVLLTDREVSEVLKALATGAGIARTRCMWNC